MRELSDNERQLIGTLASWLEGTERENLLRDLEIAFVAEEEDLPRSIIFGLRGYTRPPYKGQRPYSVEAMAVDADGENLHIMLYHDQKQRLLEMEIIRWDGRPLLRKDIAQIAKASLLGSVVEGDFTTKA